MTFEEFKKILDESKNNYNKIEGKIFNGFVIPNNFHIGGYNFEKCIFNVHFNQTTFKNTDFQYCYFNFIQFNKNHFIKTRFNLCSFPFATFDFTNINNENVVFRNCNFTDTNIKNLDISKIMFDSSTIGLSMVCPEEGEFIAYKVAKYSYGKALIKLLIPKDALRSSATTRKCRCNKARVLEITSLQNGKKLKYARSFFNNNFQYDLGEMVEVKDFDTNRWDECSNGIHFFITKQEAINYNKC